MFTPPRLATSSLADPPPPGEGGRLWSAPRPLAMQRVAAMPDPLLEVRALDAHYGDFQALFGVSISVAEGGVVAVIGANGAGKSTLLKCIAGAMAARPDAIVLAGEAVGGLAAHAM